MHAVEIDSEVLAYLRDKIEDFNETPNSVLRRELRLAARSNRQVESDSVQDSHHVEGSAPDAQMPLSAPEALLQILEVVQLVRRNGMDRVRATLRVAERRRIERETVADKYGRQMDLSTEEFDRLLSEPTLDTLRQRLSAKFPRHREEIGEILAKLSK